jgi:hypothetical protein
MSICLDWSEICDGKVDCIDGVDEKDCWSLITNECKNGQCIPKIFLVDDLHSFECLDRSSKHLMPPTLLYYTYLPTFEHEDIVCSCARQHRAKIEQAILYDKLGTTINGDCFFAFNCYSKILKDYYIYYAPISAKMKCILN